MADVFSCLKIAPSPENGLDSLTMFADYRVPQVLVYLEALEYSIELKDILRRSKQFFCIRHGFSGCLLDL